MRRWERQASWWTIFGDPEVTRLILVPALIWRTANACWKTIRRSVQERHWVVGSRGARQ